MAKETKEPTELPKVFIRERMKPGMRSKDLAEKMDTSDAQVSRLLSGKRKLTLEWLYAFSKALGVHISDLFTPPNEEVEPIRGDDQIIAMLNRIEGVDERAREMAFMAIKIGLDVSPQTKSSRIGADDQSDSSTLRRVSPPSPEQS